MEKMAEKCGLRIQDSCKGCRFEVRGPLGGISCGVDALEGSLKSIRDQLERVSKSVHSMIPIRRGDTDWVGQRPKTIDMPDVPIHLALKPSEIELIQLCCEFAEQFSQRDNKEQQEFIQSYMGEEAEDVTVEDMHWAGDHFSFELRRILEEAKKLWEK